MVANGKIFFFNNRGCFLSFFHFCCWFYFKVEEFEIPIVGTVSPAATKVSAAPFKPFSTAQEYFWLQMTIYFVATQVALLARYGVDIFISDTPSWARMHVRKRDLVISDRFFVTKLDCLSVSNRNRFLVHLSKMFCLVIICWMTWTMQLCITPTLWRKLWMMSLSSRHPQQCFKQAKIRKMLISLTRRWWKIT